MLAISIPEKIKRAVDRHPDWTDNRIQKSAGGSQAMIRAVRAGEPLPPTVADARPVLPAPEAPANGAGLISIDRIRERYDIKGAILQALTKLPDGKLLRESDLCQLTAGSDRNRFRRAVENNADTFRELRVKIRIDEAGDGTWLWGQREDVAEAVRMRDL